MYEKNSLGLDGARKVTIWWAVKSFSHPSPCSRTSSFRLRSLPNTTTTTTKIVAGIQKTSISWWLQRSRRYDTTRSFMNLHGVKKWRPCLKKKTLTHTRTLSVSLCLCLSPCARSCLKTILLVGAKMDTTRNPLVELTYSLPLKPRFAEFWTTF
jgi:hypothetical protein